MKKKYILIFMIATLLLLSNKVRALEQGEVFLLEEDGTRWDASTELNIFNTRSGERLLKPGISGEYSFTIRNTRSKDIKFRLGMQENRNFPLRYSVQDEHEEWFLGTAKEKVSLSSGEMGIQGNVPAESQLRLTLYWDWAFEEGQDVRDTHLGNTQIEEYQLFFHFRAEESEDETFDGNAGDASSDGGNTSATKRTYPRTGDDVGDFYVVFVTMLAAIILIIMVVRKKRQNRGSDVRGEIDVENMEE